MRTATRAELAELHRRLGTTVLYVTHDQTEAMTLATRVAVLEAGRLQQVGTPQDVYDRPANTFVAQFIGSPPMNVLSAEVVDEDGTRCLRLPSGALGLTAADAAAAEGVRYATVVVGVRPEELRVAEAGLAAKVRVVESLGHERHLLCELDGGSEVVVRAPASAASPGEGTAVHLAAEPSRLHLFDADTGRRLTPAA
jgi:multiple sugar transport system ATP-binding protein